MTFKRNRLRDAIAFALVAGAASLASGAAFAQETLEDAPTPDALDTVVVTGTRIQSQAVTSSSPVTEIPREEFQFAGATRVDDLVNQYPQLNPYFDSQANNPSVGYPTVDLRGLGPQRTLTLVNGFRMAQGANETPDISIVPAALVSRVDILTGGASAVYGSDAIAGVVNFVLDTEFEGVSVNVGYNAYQHDNDNGYLPALMDARDFPYPRGNSGLDGVSKNVDIAMGSSFADGAGHAMAWLTWRDNDALFQSERDYSSCTLNDAGNQCGGSDTNAAGNFYVFQAASETATPASLDADGSWRDAYGAKYNFAPLNYYQRPDERYTFGSSLKYEVNDHLRPYIETMFVSRTDSTQIAESGAFFTSVPGLRCDNALVGSLCDDLGLDPAEPFTVYVAKRNVEGGPRIRVDENTAWRAVVGAEGDINDRWSYNASLLHASARDDSQGFNDFLTPRIRSAILGCPAGSFRGCIPYNVWQPGGVTQQAAAALAGVSIYETSTALTSLNAYVTGSLGWGFASAGGAPVSVVLGGETRRAEYNFTADSESQAGNFAGSGGPQRPVDGQIKVSELFLESAVPLLSDAGLLDNLTLDLGYRLSDYDRSGNAGTYKIGFGADIGGFRVRGGYNHAIRAPGTNNLFAPQAIALFTGSDPCAGATPELTPAQCANTGVTPTQYGRIAASGASQYNQFIGGNIELVPEVADTWTLGFVVTPIDGLQLTADYYTIELEDTITAIGANLILRTCALTGDPFLCDRVNRSANGDLFRGSDPLTSGYVENFTDNFGEQTYRGIDLGGSWRWEALGGRFYAGMQGSYLLDKEIVPLPGINEEAAFECAGRINATCQDPEWRHIANLRFTRDWYSLNARWRYYGELAYEDDDGVALDEDLLVARNGGIGGYSYLDLSGSAYIGEYGELTLGVNNVADKEPPMVGATLALNGNAPGGYDQAGRFVFASFAVKF